MNTEDFSDRTFFRSVSRDSFPSVSPDALAGHTYSSCCSVLFMSSSVIQVVKDQYNKLLAPGGSAIGGFIPDKITLARIKSEVNIH
jgi:hypothetical protein